MNRPPFSFDWPSLFCVGQGAPCRIRTDDCSRRIPSAVKREMLGPCQTVARGKYRDLGRHQCRKAGYGRLLVKRAKAELVALLMEIASGDRGVQRRLDSRLGLDVPPKELVAATRQAIAEATDFDEREINRNFSYDYQAYGAVKRNLGRLVKQGHLPAAMDLALELMASGSYQVEMSDEGLVSQDIEECLQVVIKALRQCDLPADDVIAWCSEILKEDRIMFLCRKELQALQHQFDASRSL